MEKFPTWSPKKYTLMLIKESTDRVEAFVRFRNSSSNYIKNHDVRKHVFSKSKNKCVFCGTSIDLQVDHIVSVLRCFYAEKYFFCNSEENLQTLCKKCNTSKLP